MNCEVCGGKTQVIDSRHGSRRDIEKLLNTDYCITRRRRCVDCGATFRTVEATVHDLEDLARPRKRKAS